MGSQRRALPREQNSKQLRFVSSNESFDFDSISDESDKMNHDAHIKSSYESHGHAYLIDTLQTSNFKDATFSIDKHSKHNSYFKKKFNRAFAIAIARKLALAKPITSSCKINSKSISFFLKKKNN